MSDWILPKIYFSNLSLDAGGNASALTTTTQDAYGSVGAVDYALSSFIFGKM